MKFVLNDIHDFDLGQTLECGQCFHFVKLDENEYVLTAFGKVLHIAQTGDKLIFFDTDEKEYNQIWKKYFDMERDYSFIKRSLLEKDDKLRLAIDRMWGVRILNQDFFETLISFIISQNKQIPHIKKIVADISESYGTFMGEYGGNKMFAFPTLDQLSDITTDELKSLKTGFRAPYIMDAINKVREGSINANVLRTLDTKQCNEMLCSIKGVGPKVANCVSLFSLGKRDSFPIDVWIKRIMEALYFDGKTVSNDSIASLAGNIYGELGGYAQQYLFYYGKTVRLGLDK